MIDLQMELAEPLSDLMGAEHEIRDALTNLIFNAVDAMPSGGQLTLRTRIVPSASRGDTVAVEVTDAGVGMDEDTRRRCLEPFYTTKGERGRDWGSPWSTGWSSATVPRLRLIAQWVKEPPCVSYFLHTPPRSCRRRN